jgi:hypothetical protein
VAECDVILIYIYIYIYIFFFFIGDVILILYLLLLFDDVYENIKSLIERICCTYDFADC